MTGTYPQICPKCKKKILHHDVVLDHIKYCDIKPLTKEDLDELEHFRKTKIPRCPICKKNYVQISQYIWQQDCNHNKNRRLSIG